MYKGLQDYSTKYSFVSYFVNLIELYFNFRDFYWSKSKLYLN